MKPESICVSLETAKKLKEAGWDKETVFYWYEGDLSGDGELWSVLEMEDVNEDFARYPAPTASEIELPTGCKLRREVIRGRVVGDRISTDFYEYVMNNVGHSAATEVEAKAQKWIYLKEKI